MPFSTEGHQFTFPPTVHEGSLFSMSIPRMCFLLKCTWIILWTIDSALKQSQYI